MACELPSNYVAARSWTFGRNPNTSTNARLSEAPAATASTSCGGSLTLVGKTLQTFQGLFIFTFDGEPIELFR